MIVQDYIYYLKIHTRASLSLSLFFLSPHVYTFLFYVSQKIRPTKFHLRYSKTNMLGLTYC